MIPRLLLMAFVLAHAAIHAGFLAPRPPATAGGPAWPFELRRSWLLAARRLDPEVGRLIGIALVALTFCGFGLAALAAIGVGPASLWSAGIVVGAVASIAVLVLFFHPWLVLGVVIDLVLLWAAFVGHWTPDVLGVIAAVQGGT